MNKKKTTSKNNKYKVVLVTDDKKEEKEVKENETLKLEKKEKEGYVFKGWEDEDGKLYTDEVKILKDLKLKAVFEKKKIKLHNHKHQKKITLKFQIIKIIIALQKNIIVIKDIL